MNPVEEQSHQVLRDGAALRARARDLLIPICGLEGSVREATGVPGRNADIIKALKQWKTPGHQEEKEVLSMI